MSEAYHTFFISPFSFSLLRHHLAFILQFVNNADPTDFASNMLNLSKTFVTYFSSYNHSTFLVLSRTMCIPKICLAPPRCFMANDLPSACCKYSKVRVVPLRESLKKEILLEERVSFVQWNWNIVGINF